MTTPHVDVTEPARALGRSTNFPTRRYRVRPESQGPMHTRRGTRSNSTTQGGPSMGSAPGTPSHLRESRRTGPENNHQRLAPCPSIVRRHVAAMLDLCSRKPLNDRWRGRNRLAAHASPCVGLQMAQALRQPPGDLQRERDSARRKTANRLPIGGHLSGIPSLRGWPAFHDSECSSFVFRFSSRRLLRALPTVASMSALSCGFVSPGSQVYNSQRFDLDTHYADHASQGARLPEFKPSFFITQN